MDLSFAVDKNTGCQPKNPLNLTALAEEKIFPFDRAAKARFGIREIGRSRRSRCSFSSTYTKTPSFSQPRERKDGKKKKKRKKKKLRVNGFIAHRVSYVWTKGSPAFGLEEGEIHRSMKLLEDNVVVLKDFPAHWSRYIFRLPVSSNVQLLSFTSPEPVVNFTPSA